MIVVRAVTIEDNLQQVVSEINQSAWDDDNEISLYDVESLSAYLDHQGTLFLVCHEVAENQKKLLGIASSRVEIKPYQQERWLYVDEVDVCADQRQKGAGKAIMQELIKIARETSCKELWLGAEVDNFPANALYQSLKPHEIEKFTGYTYKTGSIL